MTGGAQGLGAAMCHELADAGATLVMADRSEHVHRTRSEMREARATPNGKRT